MHQLTRLAEQKPVLFVLEDAHWIDPTTQELVTRLIDGIASTRVLTLITARPEFLSPWTGRDHVTSLALSRLSKTQCAELIVCVASARVLKPALVEDIVAKTDGVPLFVEELTKAVMESATPDRPAVPATLHDSLMARLDRLGPAREIAQVAAVIGQQFSFALLEKVSPVSIADLATGIARLVDAGLAFPQSQASEPSYSFKHALLRDVAYDNLLRGRRQQFHEQVARALEEHFPAVARANRNSWPNTSLRGALPNSHVRIMNARVIEPRLDPTLPKRSPISVAVSRRLANWWKARIDRGVNLPFCSNWGPRLLS